MVSIQFTILFLWGGVIYYSELGLVLHYLLNETIKINDDWKIVDIWEVIMFYQ